MKERKIEEGEPAGQEVTSEDMLQIKSFGTKEESCQATNTEQGYRGNRGDPKLDLRNGVTRVFHEHACSHTCISLRLPLCCFQGPQTNRRLAFPANASHKENVSALHNQETRPFSSSGVFKN